MSMRSVVIILFCLICFTLIEASRKIVNPKNEPIKHPKVASVEGIDFCYGCLKGNEKGYKKNYKQLPVYAVLSSNHKASFGPSFTICMSVTNPAGQEQSFFSILDQDENVTIQAYLMNDVERATLFLIFGTNVAHSPNISVPLVFPYQWVRSCLAMSSQSGHVQWVIDGRVVENTTLEALQEVSENIPKNLTGKLLLGANRFAPGW